MPADVGELFLKPLADVGGALLYRPMIAGVARLHYVDSKSGVDIWTKLRTLHPLLTTAGMCCGMNRRLLRTSRATDKEPQSGARYAELPSTAVRPSSYEQWGKSLKDHLYQNAKLTIYACDKPKLGSKAGEGEGDFRTRLSQALREQRDAMVEKLRSKYAPRVQSLQDQLRRSHDRLPASKRSTRSRSSPVPSRSAPRYWVHCSVRAAFLRHGRAGRHCGARGGTDRARARRCRARQ